MSYFSVTCTNSSGDLSLTVLIKTDTTIDVQDFRAVWDKNSQKINEKITGLDVSGDLTSILVESILIDHMQDNFPGVSCEFFDIPTYQLYGVDV